MFQFTLTNREISKLASFIDSLPVKVLGYTVGEVRMVQSIIDDLIKAQKKFVLLGKEISDKEKKVFDKMQKKFDEQQKNLSEEEKKRLAKKMSQHLREMLENTLPEEKKKYSEMAETTCKISLSDKKIKKLRELVLSSGLKSYTNRDDFLNLTEALGISDTMEFYS